MRQAERPVNRFARTVQMAGRRIAGFGAITGVVAAGALARMVKGSFSTIDATSKLADQLGLSTKQLVGYQHAAKLSGVTNEQLGTAFKRMSKNISDAVLGLTTAKRAFSALGLDADRLIKLSPDQQFKAIADALGGVKLQSDKVRVALDLFGRSGLGILTLTKDGAAGLTKWQKEAEKLGLTFSRLAGAKVEKAVDAMGRVGEVLEGISRTISIELAPAIELMSKKFTDWATAGEGAAKRVKRAMADVAPEAAFLGGVGQYAKAALLAGFSQKARLFGIVPSAFGMTGISRAGVAAGRESTSTMNSLFGVGGAGGAGAASTTAPRAKDRVATMAELEKTPLFQMAAGLRNRRAGFEPRMEFEPFQQDLSSSLAFGSGHRELAAPGLALPDMMQSLFSLAKDMDRKLENIEENTASAA